MKLKSLLAVGLITAGLAIVPSTSNAASVPPGAAALSAAQFAVQTGDLNGTTCRNKRTAIMSKSIKAGPYHRRHNYLEGLRVGYKSCLARHMDDTVRPQFIRFTVVQTTDEDCGDHFQEHGYRQSLARVSIREAGGRVTQMPLAKIKCVDAGGMLALRHTVQLNNFRAFPVRAKNGRLQNPMVSVIFRVDWNNSPDGVATDFALMSL